MLSLSVLVVLLSTVNNTSGVSVVVVLMVMLSSVENHVFKCCQELTVCVRLVSVIVKCPLLPPRVVDGRSRNPLYYYYYSSLALVLSILMTVWS